VISSTTTYYVEANNAACTSARTAVVATVKFSSSSTVTATACNSYTLNGNTYTATGTYTQTLTNAAGCDSTITLNLTIPVVDVSVTPIDSSLNANATSATFQWLNCDSAYEVVPGATSALFGPTVTGHYAVAVSQGGCTDTSACYLVTLTASESMVEMSGMTLSPNPSNGSVLLDLGKVYAHINITVMDAKGAVISTFSADGLQIVPVQITGAAGLYLISVQNGNKPPVLLKAVKE
jgi:hypothetical protein